MYAEVRVAARARGHSAHQCHSRADTWLNLARVARVARAVARAVAMEAAPAASLFERYSDYLLQPDLERIRGPVHSVDGHTASCCFRVI